VKPLSNWKRRSGPWTSSCDCGGELGEEVTR
jgi:hypothetical protein